MAHLTNVSDISVQYNFTLYRKGLLVCCIYKMENNERVELMQEYVKRFSNPKYWLIRFCGFNRFSIKNKTIVKKSLGSVIFGIFVIITFNLLLVNLVYETAVRTHYLLFAELGILIEVSLILNAMVASITFGNRNNGLKIINHNIEIDLLLGKNDTKFMRDISDSFYTVIGIPILVIQVTTALFLYLTFEVSPLAHFTGTVYFTWVFVIFFDISYLVNQSIFLNLRTRYLNVALMKYLNVEVEYLPDLFFFSGIFWKQKHTEVVNFHKKANTEKFVNAYKIMFTHMKYFEDSMRFLVSIHVYFGLGMFIDYYYYY